MTTRLIVAHIHLFKNAGTSIEASLRGAFGDRWISHDGTKPGQRVLQDDLETFLRSNPDIACVSSHQLRPPLEESTEFSYLPIVFLRHPIDRIRSAYDFEKHQGPVSPSARAAAELPFADWIRFHDDRGSTQCANFQTYALSSLRNDTNGAPLMRQPTEAHLAAAQNFLDALGAVGTVEQFSESMAAIQQWLQARLPAFEWASQFLNTTRSQSSTLEDRLAAVEQDLGTSRFADLIQRNAADVTLHHATSNRLRDASR